jgi:uncharacterized protein YecE (DUF72 family)
MISIGKKNMNFRIGCAVWSYKGWVGNLYPDKSQNRDFLKLYSQRFLTVEGNTTFYAVPEAKTVRKWREETANNFRFCLKFPRDITHQGLLFPQVDRAIAFIDRVVTLEDKLGCIFVQLPPNYSPIFWEDLVNFLQALPRDKIRFALEVRHLDWFAETENTRLNKLLKNLGMARVILDTRPIYNCPEDPQLNSLRKKPLVPLVAETTTDFTLIRFISHPQAEYNCNYLDEWIERIDRWLQQRVNIYFFVHCPIEDYSPQTAKKFQQLLEHNKVLIPALPWNELDFIPQQLNLFGGN